MTTFGVHLPDQVPTIASALSAQLAVESDVAAFLAERAALEREYASKLQLLSRKYRDKKAKREQECAVGPNPTREWNKAPTSLGFYIEELFIATDASTAESNSLAAKLEQTSSHISTSERKRDELRKKHTAYAQKLLSDRDRIYADREKAKAKYDELCHELESHRQKREKAQAGDKHADRAAKAFATAESDMWNAKNSYLIQIAVSNRAKQKFYRDDLPTVQDSLQNLWTSTTQSLASSIAQANSAVAAHHEGLASKFQALGPKRSRVDPASDQQLFVLHNEQRWQEPGEWSFEPCVGFFDTPEMSTEPTAVTFLQNRLIKCRNKMAELEPLASGKRKEIDSLENVRSAYAEQEGLGDADDVHDNLFEATKMALAYEIELHGLTAEVDTIEAAIGDNQGEGRPHRFKPTSFTIPTSCNFCGGTIWGIAKQGAVCKPCGYTVHQKCEMKVAADCKASSGVGHTVSRTSSPAPSRLQPGKSSRAPSPLPPAASSVTSAANPKGTILYAFDASSPFELSVAEGDAVELIEDDADNTGWIKVKHGTQQGLVPTSYCNFDATADNTATAPVPQGCGKFVRALYGYEAQDADELSLAEGERIEITATGFDYADGWCQGVKQGKMGIFPSNYVEAL